MRRNLLRPFLDTLTYLLDQDRTLRAADLAFAGIVDLHLQRLFLQKVDQALETTIRICSSFARLQALDLECRVADGWPGAARDLCHVSIKVAIDVPLESSAGS